MNLGRAWQLLLAEWQSDRLRATIIFLYLAWAPLCWKFFGSHEFCLRHCPAPDGFISDPQLLAALYRFGSCLVLFGLVPMGIVKLLLRQRLADYGLTLGHWKRTLAWTVALLPLFALLSCHAARNPVFQAEYPINKHAAEMFPLHAASYLAFYIGWEFFFRGFLLFGLAGRIGAVNAVLLQAAVSAMMHIGDPAQEAFGAVLGGLIWGAAALHSRSLLPALLQHAAMGIAVDYLICFHAQV